MQATPVIAVFDVGKTNKKLFLFNQDYKIVYEESVCLTETKDEEGYPCENLESLRAFIQDSLQLVFCKKEFSIKAINIAAYGASFVYIDEQGNPVLPLYNYLKPYPEALQQKLYTNYGGEDAFARATASPVLGSLNSGLQLYRIKEEQPERFQKIACALHLPQYLSYLISGETYSEMTSIGCHTALWDFEKVRYHDWVTAETLLPKLAPIRATTDAVTTSISGNKCAVGVGVHDSSAALIPYSVQFREPFVLLSTGTWCISLNPFNNTPLTAAELAQDCLCYLDYKGNPVKAARLFLGPQYDAGIQRICDHFNQSSGHYRNVQFDANLLLQRNVKAGSNSFADLDLNLFKTDIEAYHYLLFKLMKQQYRSTNIVLQHSTVKRIFVDGGFSKNEVFMNLLAAYFPGQEVYAASMAQGTALGAALAIHHSWNDKEVPAHIVDLKYYSRTFDLV